MIYPYSICGWYLQSLILIWMFKCHKGIVSAISEYVFESIVDLMNVMMLELGPKHAVSSQAAFRVMMMRILPTWR